MSLPPDVQALNVDGWERVLRIDDDLGPAAYVALHSTGRGPAFGGIRRRAYATADDALQDAKRLSAAMTRKCALAGLAAGGGKSTLIEHPERDATATYRRLGALIEWLGGSYVCGPDVGTSTAQLDVIRTQTTFVNPPQNDPGMATARGVLSGMQGLARVHLASTLAGRAVAIEGLGAVGTELARLLLEQGSAVCGWDLVAEARERAADLGVRECSDPMRMPCDILAPCALGGVLNAATAPGIGARAICGSANNQLHHPDVEVALMQRDIVYVPDEVVSAGAVIEGVLTVLEGESAETRNRIDAHIARIADTTAHILSASRADGVLATEVATRLVLSSP